MAEPVEGFEYNPMGIIVSRDHQAEKLDACGIDAAVFGDDLDPAFAIGRAIEAGIESGISAEGNVNMVQRLVQHAPVRLDEPLTVRGTITEVREVPRGWVVSTDAWFENWHGDRVLSAPRRSLKPDPERVGERGAGDRPAPVVGDVADLAEMARYTLSPESVCRYSMAGNSIHYEPEAAARAGFRAPIIGGGQGVHYLTAALWRAGRVRTMAVEIYFRRPIFWDETVWVGALDRRALALCKDGKVGTEMALRALQRY